MCVGAEGGVHISVFSDLRGVMLLLGVLYSGKTINKIHEVQVKKSVPGSRIMVSDKRC